VIAVKSGRTASGSKAVSSHTGSLAGSDAAYDAAFLQAGVLRADSVQELFDWSTAFAYQPLLKGNRIAIVTNAGGPGVMATDALERCGLVLADAPARDRSRPCRRCCRRRPTSTTPWTCWATRRPIATLAHGHRARRIRASTA
jgi:acyl-CoA synthetase (NDP forming)